MQIDTYHALVKYIITKKCKLKNGALQSINQLYFRTWHRTGEQIQLGENFASLGCVTSSSCKHR